MSKVYFITGGNRGIGFDIVKVLSKKPNTKVIATTRNVEKSTDLLELQKKNKNIEIVKLDVSSEESIAGLDSQLKKVASEGIDVYISNAAIAYSFYQVKDAPTNAWLDHYKTNVLGPLLVYKVVLPFLEKKETKQIAFVSSLAGSIGGFFPFSSSAYGQSKAALNYSVKEISYELESEGFTVIAIHPGVVASDMGNYSIANTSDEKVIAALNELKITTEESALKQVEVFDSLTKESNGKFLSYDGSELPW